MFKQLVLKLALDILVLPADPEARLPSDDIPRVELAFFSQDVFPGHSRQFFSAVRKALRHAEGTYGLVVMAVDAPGDAPSRPAMVPSEALTRTAAMPTG